MGRITVILDDIQQDHLDKLAGYQQATTSEIIRLALDFLWCDLGAEAEELAQARAAIARRLEGTDDASRKISSGSRQDRYV